MTFQNAFCTRTRCGEAGFEKTLFRRAVYPHALLLAWLIRRVAPGFFKEDMEFIRWLGGQSSFSRIREDIRRYRHETRFQRHWLRKRLRLSLDPDRLKEVARTCMPA